MEASEQAIVTFENGGESEPGTVQKADRQSRYQEIRLLLI
jgi:hypothetical protein